MKTLATNECDHGAAASHGLPGAYTNLGVLWECGAGGLQDHEEAALCYAHPQRYPRQYAGTIEVGSGS